MKTVSFYTKEELRFLDLKLRGFIREYAFWGDIPGSRVWDLIDFYEKLDTKGGAFMNIDEIGLFMKNQVNKQKEYVERKRKELQDEENRLDQYREIQTEVDTAKNTMHLFTNLLKDYE